MERIWQRLCCCCSCAQAIVHFNCSISKLLIELHGEHALHFFISTSILSTKGGRMRMIHFQESSCSFTWRGIQTVILHDVESKPLLYWEFPGSRDSQFPSYLTGYVKKQVPVIYKCCYSTGVSCKMESCFLTGFHFTVLYLYFNSI